MDELSQQTLRGYEVRDLIAEGGFGAVYRAYQPLLKREVAIKVILPQYANDPDFIRRFEIEAELIARLEHPHIVPLFDYWREPNGAYLVMRLLRQGSLKDKLQGGVLSIQQAVTILDHIAAALHLAHRHHVIHRDIKPSNILFDNDDNAYLTDFGIAKNLDYDSHHYGEGITGSLPYMPPEMLEGEVATPQSDIYALGLVLFEILSGYHPFKGSSLNEVLHKQISEPLPSICEIRPELPSEVDDIVQQATAKQPAERFATVQEMADNFHLTITGTASITIPSPSQDSREDDTLIDLPNPYQGLRSFQEVDAERFFGRTALIEQLLQRLISSNSDGRFLAIVGPSGSGKSSVVKAGILPAIRRGELPNSEKWFITEMYPGMYPFVELEAALLRIAAKPPENLINQLQADEQGLLRATKQLLPAADDSQLLIVIDQFEELFTLVEDNKVCELFLENLMTVIKDTRSRTRFIITLRADFYDKPLQYREFGELLRKHTEIILPLSETELQEAIVQPAQTVGVELQTGLVEAISKDVKEQPGMLPLLQYALTELFERRLGWILTLDTYREIGGVTGALARRAEELLTNVDETGQATVRQLFLRLVTLGEGTEDTRRRVRRSELPDIPQMEAILQVYGQHRLLTFDRDAITREPTVEIAHEALIGTWQSLRDWINLHRDDLRWHRRLTAATAEWLESDQDPGLLAHETRLQQFESWANNTEINLNIHEKRYLHASITAQKQRRLQEEARKAHEALIARRVQNFQRASVVLGAITVLLVIVGLVAGFATLNAYSTQATVAYDATYFAIVQGRSATLASGGIIVPSNYDSPAAEDFMMTETAIAELTQFEPVVREFDGVEMVLVPPGCFWMGSSIEIDEQPPHEICFEQPYWIDRYEVSNQQFDDYGGQAARLPERPASDQPRALISWLEANSFCATRNARLPTEAEWVYAARGPESRTYPWGNTFIDEYVAYKLNSSSNPQAVTSHPEGASWVGAHHMSGNVREFSSTMHTANNGETLYPYPYNPDDGREGGVVLDAEYLIHGGAFSDPAFALRIADRGWNYPDEGYANNGFRCARDFE